MPDLRPKREIADRINKLVNSKENVGPFKIRDDLKNFSKLIIKVSGSKKYEFELCVDLLNSSQNSAVKDLLKKGIYEDISVYAAEGNPVIISLPKEKYLEFLENAKLI